MKKVLPTASVLAILAGLAFYVLAFESKPKDPNGAKERLFKVKQADITRFRLENIDKGTQLTCEKQADGNWWITAPGRYEADTETVDMVLGQLAAPEVERKIGKSDPAQFGLDRPTFKATVETKRGKPRTLVAGSRNPSETSFFAVIEGSQEVFTIPSRTVDTINKSLSDLRSRTPAPIDPAKVSRLTIYRSNGDTLEFHRSGPEAWNMTRPSTGQADHFAVDGLLGALKSIRGTDIIDETGAAARYRLEDPLVRFEVYTETKGKGGKPLSVSLSRPNPKREDSYVISSRIPFVMRISSAALIMEASKPADDYRERLLLSVNKEDLRGVELKWRGKKLACRPGLSGKWYVTEPLKKPGGEELDDMLFEIIYVRAEKFASTAATDYGQYGLKTPQAEVTVYGVKDRRKFRHTYTLGKAKNGLAFLQWDGNPPVYGVREEILTKVARFGDAILLPGGGTAPAKPAAKKTTHKTAGPKPKKK